MIAYPEEKDMENTIVCFMGINPEPGEYWTNNRHDCSGQAQVRIRISQDRNIETYCPTCCGHPTIFYECGRFSYFGGVIF